MALTTNLVAYYSLEDDAANTHVDDQIEAHDGTLVSSNTEDISVAAKVANGLHFDGSADYINLANESGLRFNAGTQDFSMFCWIKRDAQGTNHLIYDKRDAANDGYWWQILDSDNKQFFKVNAITVQGGTALDTGWHHVGIVIDRSGNGQLWLDGSTDGSAVAISSAAMDTTATPKIGARSFSTPLSFFDGIIDEFGIWDRIVTSAEITTLYNSGDGLAYPFITELDKIIVEDTLTINDTFTASRSRKTNFIGIEDNLTVTDTFSINKVKKTYTQIIEDSISISDTISTTLVNKEPQSFTQNITDSISISDIIDAYISVETFDVGVNDVLTVNDLFSTTLIKKNQNITTYTSLYVNGNEIEVEQIDLNKSTDEFNATSNFNVVLNNYTGQFSSSFNLNDEVTIFADINTNPPTTQIFTGVVENIEYFGKDEKEQLVLSGRDYGVILIDIIANPRIFKNTEVSNIVRTLLIQNATGTGLTFNNINVTSTTLEKITFNNVSLYDCLQQLAELSGFYFYVDINKDVHFEQRNSISSGETFDNSNILKSKFNNSDADLFNKVTVYGDRILTGFTEQYPTLSNGSVFVLDSKPSNVFIAGSDATLTGSAIQPGGVFNFDDPATKDVKWLVDYNDKKIILTSGTTAGDNVGWASSGIIADYQRSTPIIRLTQDNASIATYGRKDKIIIDRNIKTSSEATDKADAFLAEHKDPKIMADIDLYGVVNITPGHTCLVNMPMNDIVNQTYTVMGADYQFTPKNNFSNSVMKVKLNKKIRNFIDYFKEQELRLRAVESANVDTSVTETVLGTGSIITEVSAWEVVSRSIGSSFYFNVTGHDILNSPKSLLGDMRAGSTVFSFP